MTSDAQDSTVVHSNIDISTMDFIENKDPLAASQDPTRVSQQQVLPNAVKTRLIGDLFSNNPASSALGSGIIASATVASSSSTSFLFSLADSQNREIIAVPDIAFYIGTFAAAYQWPNHNFGMGNMPVAVFNDWGLTNNFNVVARAIIRNNSGADQSVYCVCRFRIIANPGITQGK